MIEIPSIYETLPASTRVWIYQASQPMDVTTASHVQAHLIQFTEKWVSHNQALRAIGLVYHQQFIVLMVDESQAGASGCSIDKSVHFLQLLEQEYQLNLFDRMRFTFMDDGQVQTAARDEFARLYQEGKINDETLVFDNLVNNKGDFDAQWLKPLGESWHKRMV